MPAALQVPVNSVETDKVYERNQYEKELSQHWAKRVVEALMQDEQLTAMLADVIKQHVDAAK